MAAPNQVKVKEEEQEQDVDSKQGDHSHQFRVKFPNDNNVEYTVYCNQPCTVLEAIKCDLNKQYTMMKDKENCTDNKLIIQLGKKDKKCIVPTHLPCSCIMKDECLTIHCKTEEVEEARDHHDKILSRDKYSVFYISKEGGQNAKTRKLFRSNTVKGFSYLCVYAKRGATVKEALQEDGRFNDLEDFKLSEDEDLEQHTLCTQMVDSLDEKKFRICLYRQRKQPSTLAKSQQNCVTKSVVDQSQQSRTEGKRAMAETGDTKKIYERFPRLKEWMESTFPGDSLAETLKLNKENFGKIQQSFSQVHRVKKLFEMGESVCLLKINAFNAEVQGTGFVLYDNFVLTNAHLFEVCADLQQDKWKDYVKITVVFNFEDPDCESHKKEFKANMRGSINALDYAVLELDLENRSSNQTEEAKVPPGLLSKFGPPPKDGEACVIGHPAGGVKKMDPTCIIAKENREQAVNQNLDEYRDYIFTLFSINQNMKNNPNANVFVTYNTFMYHGASGSPVFDAHGRVFGLHSGGFYFGFVKPNESVIEFAQPLLTIFRDFVGKLREIGDEKQLKRIQEAAKRNPYLEQIIEGLSPQ